MKSALFDYALRLGDSSLIIGHRLSEWCGHGPVLEQDIALINIALDLVGQANTGTGKTAAYGLPLLQSIDAKKKVVQGIILCPTRELGQQVAKGQKIGKGGSTGTSTAPHFHY